MKRLIPALAAALCLTACGANWFPDDTKDSATTTQPAVSTTAVGTLVASIKTGPGAYTITTTRGVFTTYTSLTVPYRTEVTLERYADAGNNLPIGKVLRALHQSILVNEILALVP